jgi:acyl transferase domain-containing protein
MKSARRTNELTSAERETLRAAICVRFTHPMWEDARDDEIADMHHVPAEYVRELRAEWRRDVGVGRLLSLAHEHAVQIGWPGTDAELIEQLIRNAMDHAELRSHREPHPLAGLLEALRDQDRLVELERIGDAHAADR